MPSRSRVATKRGDTGARGLGTVRDLHDFHLRWREFRRFAVEAAGSAALNADQTATVEWLIVMADRIGEQDIAPRE
jgi:hypothetical protein